MSIELAPGTVTWLRGTNGSGKTSLMRILAGLTAPEAGELAWNSVAVRRSERDWHRHVLYLGHANGLKDDLLVVEALGFLARLAGIDDTPERLMAALRQLDIDSRAQAAVRTLSQGQRRRAALSRLALDEQPRTWLLDEPFDALDRNGVQRLNALIEAHCARGGSVLLTSHQEVEVRGLQTFDLEAFRPQPGARPS